MPRRAGPREGSIWKQVRKRKDGTTDVRWVAQVQIGYREDGKPNRYTVSAPTRAEAAKKLRELLAQHDTGRLVRRTGQTLAEYLRAWLEVHRHYGAGGQGLRPNTYRGYKNDIERHIIPYLGDVPLQEVGPDQLKGLYRHLEEEKKLSRRMAERCHRLLHRAFADAVTEGKLPTNPCDRVPSPPRVRYRADDRPYLESERIPDVLAAVRETRYYLPLFVAMSMGLRRNEVLGLAWEDVDFEAGVLRVRYQWGPLRQDSKEQGRVPVKSKAGARDLPLPAPVADALAAHKVTQEAQGLGPLVFDRGDGKPIAPGEFDHAWAAVRRKLGLPAELRLHDLRGSYITWLAEQGVDLKTASYLAGHSDIKVTAQFYQRASKKLQQEAARAIERLMSPPPASPTPHPDAP